jgi:hypothetical protein
MTRTSNPYGSRPEEQREIAHYVEMVEPLLRQGAGVELDGRAEPASLVDAVETLIAASEGSRPGADDSALQHSIVCRLVPIEH